MQSHQEALPAVACVPSVQLPVLHVTHVLLTLIQSEGPGGSVPIIQTAMELQCNSL